MGCAYMTLGRSGHIIVKWKIIHVHHLVTQFIPFLQQSILFGIDHALLPSGMSHIAHIGQWIIGKQAALLSLTHPGIYRLSSNSGRKRQLKSAHRFIGGGRMRWGWRKLLWL